MGRRGGLRPGVRIVDQAMLKSYTKRSTFGWTLGAIVLALCAATIPFASTYAAPPAANHEADDKDPENHINEAGHVRFDRALDPALHGRHAE